MIQGDPRVVFRVFRALSSFDASTVAWPSAPSQLPGRERHVERTNALIRGDEVSAIIGPVRSANRDAMQPTLERFRTPLFYATDYEGGVCSRYIWC